MQAMFMLGGEIRPHTFHERTFFFLSCHNQLYHDITDAM